MPKKGQKMMKSNLISFSVGVKGLKKAKPNVNYVAKGY